MKVAVDTSVLVRALVRADPAQARAAIKALKDATLIAVALPCLCELVWVLLKVYGFQAAGAAAAVRALLTTANVEIQLEAPPISCYTGSVKRNIMPRDPLVCVP